MSVVTRFPPSPTGFMHIGNARTALFNWLYAKRHGGQFLVRIEDTDRERYSEDAVQVILNGLDWLGLDYNNTPESQFANRDRHIAVAHTLLEKGMAWKCYYTQEELEKIKKEAGGFKLPRHYDLEKNYIPRQTEKFTIRIHTPLYGIDNEAQQFMTINDNVQGEVKVRNSELDDFVLLRSDGTPTYMLAVVVDDHDMNITHVIRGDDHLNNTFRQNVIYDALGWDKPAYAHLPLIHGPDGKKFSKRHGAQSVEEYKDMGYLPEALCNYLLRLGWSHGDDEIISREQAVEWFNLDNIQKGSANFDFTKLENLNAHYISQKDTQELIAAAKPFFETELSDLAMTRITAGIEELKKRSKTLVQFAEESQFYVDAPNTYNEGAQKNLTTDNLAVLEKLASVLADLDPFDKDTVMQACKDVAKDIANGKLGKIGMPLRAALTGSDQSPAIFEAAAILGKNETLARIQKARDTFQ